MTSCDHRAVPEQPARLPGTVWAITAFFNPAGYQNKLRNYRMFRSELRQYNLPLLVVEAAFGDRPFELAEHDADIVIQLRTSSVLWHKERLLQIGAEHLPPECDKVVWLDSDIIFTNTQWLSETCVLLERYVFVQPFAAALRLPKETTYPIATLKAPFPRDGHLSFGAANRRSNGTQRPKLVGVPGYAGAFRRKLLAEVGFYDKAILGGGDAIMVWGALGLDPGPTILPQANNQALLDDVAGYARRLFAVTGGSVSFVPGTIFHLWHGDIGYRHYVARARLLKDFDVEHDLRLNGDGLWEWATDKPVFHGDVRRYFYARSEEGVRLAAFHQYVLFLFSLDRHDPLAILGKMRRFLARLLFRIVSQWFSTTS